MSQAITSWSTAEVGPNRALSYWEEALASAQIAVAVSPSQSHRLEAVMTRAPFAQAWLNAGDMSAQHAERSRREINLARTQYYLLFQVRAGRGEIAQYGRNVVLAPGQCTLVDTKAPYTFSFGHKTDCVSLQMPQDWLARWVMTPEDSVARPFDTGAGWGRPLTAMLANLSPLTLDGLGLPRHVVLDQIGAMLALASTAPRTLTRHQESLVQRLIQSVHERCHEPDLDPAALASSFGLSRRYVHTLFARAGTSFGRQLIQARLDLAARLLKSRSFASASVTEIALRCGFADGSHFARRFRACYGVTPTRFRGGLHS